MTEPPSRNRSRSRSPPRKPKSSGGFRWKDKGSRANDSFTRDFDDRNRDDAPRRSPPRRSDGDRDRYRDRSDRRDGNQDSYRPRSPRRDDRDKYRDGGDRRRSPRRDGGRDERKEKKKEDKPKEKEKEKKPKVVAAPSRAEPMIIVNVNDRLGTKAAIPCLGSDPVKAFKAMVAARIGRQPHEIMLKRQGERPFKDHLTLDDYGVSNGVQLDLELDTGD
ncbi:hypothetical protein AUEXF2481DRAFT_30725 [Aureobasidium subglaciale EXF-2481]|uniref:Ubiquitin-like modifier HUB1 n=1 Tax=Aureobasidium subglaciale (strain EXF-2481) TaxID=1043005 RepID=A0A074Y8X5_AURSE|nr:uncharacterized protein AUEXF2481DRAFT_30725 [Aureobasidium subglaciale EXF-2481]KAI5208392.1 hypothetical protein E4T38_02833 [Aureobasidium subglaciale]KAI5227306.1 hypothetical protein E4T40_02727 [Aureobasidium subglaciale]KAI5230486.1 hypothetical protein E4T41_02832 [Aureobasidium subglaciale]KAI5264888.1 hypothetical protein E4T46_02610 [Aureobasidium subglaciale]KEQ94185.1 hypothetical protein AUEXF2481DRAFT_30725 [Aureobasidium subglaciale EXF-2481]